jgi:hypothetical protein
MMDYL